MTENSIKTIKEKIKIAWPIVVFIVVASILMGIGSASLFVGLFYAFVCLVFLWIELLPMIVVSKSKDYDSNKH